MTPRTTRPTRRTSAGRALATLTALLGLVAAALVWAAPAHADTFYRYWGYYVEAGGKWTYATKGASAITSKDGAVEGWRYAVAGSAPRTPRAAGDFAQLCRGVSAVAGKKRVGVVLDPGLRTDAPRGSSAPTSPTGYCVVAPTSATDLAVLSAAAPVAQTKGLVCEILRYPSTGCDSAAVKGVTPPAHDAAARLASVTVVGAPTPPPTSASTPAETMTPLTPASGAPSAASSSSTGQAAPVTTSQPVNPTADSSSHRTVWIIVVAAVVIVLAAAALVLTRRRRGSSD